MKFLVDVNLPPDLVVWFQEKGHEAVYVGDVLPSSHPDESICRFARARDFIVVSKDADLVEITRRTSGPPVVWIRSGNLRRPEFRSWMDVRSNRMFQLLAQGEQIIELA